MMPLQPPAAHTSTSSRSAFSTIGHCSLCTRPSVRLANDIGPSVGTRPYFFIVGQSCGAIRSKPYAPRRAASRHCSSNVVSPGVFWPKTVRKSDCFRRPLRFTGPSTLLGAVADGAWANPAAGAIAAAATAAADEERNSRRFMRRILYSRPMKRREFLAAGVGVAGVVVSAVASAQGRRPILVKGGCVLSLDPRVGDFDAADVLIDGEKIAAVGPNLSAANADVIDASHAIVMPGLIDTHRHMWEGPLRNILPNGLLSDYTRDITGAARAIYRPEDAHAGDLVSALGAINAGVTTVLDWSHIGNS